VIIFWILLRIGALSVLCCQDGQGVSSIVTHTWAERQFGGFPATHEAAAWVMGFKAQ